MSLSPLQLAAGFALSLLIGLAAQRRGALTRDGVAGAAIVGTLTFGLGGFAWAVVVVAFFVSSSALTRYGAERKRESSAEFAKGGRRDLAQTLANGGAAAVLAVSGAIFPAYTLPIFAAFAGAMAAVTADTWATELGMLSLTPPRMVTTWRETRTGENGAVSTLGLISAATGALLIGSAALLGRYVEGFFADVPLSAYLWLPTTALIAGFIGSVVDSLLGATVQALYYCASDAAYTEKPIHACGRPAILTRGLAWMDNDVVNFLASLAGAVTAVLVYGAMR
ncbi:MAG: DUF92 domain-containing protein [Chloroflexi bacterium]|nr:DUF92 domain-containing protein [Chloroflexota bacterium]